MIPQFCILKKKHIRREVKSVLESFGEGNGHVFNLGHGVLPDVDPENVKALVQYVKEESVFFHRGGAEAQRN